jgi:hypothetical protein
LSSRLTLGAAHYELNGWTGAINGQETNGYELWGRWRLPWEMDLGLSFAGVDADSATWLMTSQQIEWEVKQSLLLLDGALLAGFKMWGRHLLDPIPGSLDIQTYTPLRTQGQNSLTNLNILNYTIDVQVDALILAFTDSNMLQDTFWTQNPGLNWDPEYAIMSNQIPEYRFRYFSLIWVFQN